MQPTPAAVRQTIFAILSAIELDLRQSIMRHILSQTTSGETYNEQLLVKLKDRFDRSGNEATANVSDSDFLLYFDFSDHFELFGRHKNILSDEVVRNMETLTPRAPQIAPIRNRVMHSRPLDPDDFAQVYDFATEALKCYGLDWSELRSTMKRLADEPSFVLKLKIPEIPWDSTPAIPHNLPLPEFDDTGYIGRSKDRSDITKLILGHHQIVTILGSAKQ